jgi:putative transposase
MLRIVDDAAEHREGETDQPLDLDELCRLAAREMIAVALEAERRAYLERFAAEVDATGRRLVIGNGYARPREITTAAGRVEVQAPRVHDRRPGEQFISAILPPYMRRSPRVTEVLPLLYLRGLSTGDFIPALGEFFGSEAGLSASTVQRLTKAWQAEHERWQERSLATVDYVYLWADGVHFNVRLEEDRLCCLVLVGVRPDGTKELVAVQDGYREDTQSWLDLLRDLKQRGMTAPELAIGDGALGFWAALREVFPTTREQRCWLHKTANALSALPDRMRGEAKTALQAIYTAETRAAALDAARAFAEQFAAWPKATAKITDDLERLLSFFDFPAEHHVHLRTTNPIESTFATVRLRQRVTKGAGSREAGLAMAFKLLDAAQARWRRVNAPHLVAVVRAGGVFIDGQLQERKSDSEASAERDAA